MRSLTSTQTSLTRKLMLFTFLVTSLGLTKSWTQSTNLYGQQALASVAAADADIVVTVTNADKKSQDVIVTIHMEERTSEVLKGYKKDADGNLVPEKVSQTKYIAHFSTSTCSSCIDTLEVQNLSDVEVLKVHAKNDLEKFFEKQIAINERKENEAKCKIKIVNENDASQDIDLTKKANIADKVRCQANRLEGLENEGKEVSVKQFSKAMSKNLEAMIFNSNPDIRAQGQDLVQELGLQFDNPEISDYLFGVETVSNDFEILVEKANKRAAAEASKTAVGMAEAYQLNQEMQKAKSYYSTGQYKYETNTTAEEVFAKNDLSTSMVRYIDEAIGNSQKFIAQFNNTDMDLDRSTDSSALFGRAQRSSTSYNGIPKWSFDNNNTQTANNQQQVGANGVPSTINGRQISTNGGYIPGQPNSGNSYNPQAPYQQNPYQQQQYQQQQQRGGRTVR